MKKKHRRKKDSLRSKRFRGVSAQISMFWPRENWGESKKERGGRVRGEKEKDDDAGHMQYMGRVMRKGPGRHILSIFSFKLFCPLHSPNNMMEVIKVRK